MKKEVANPGSALGEAIGVLIEDAVHRMVEPIVKDRNCTYITVGPKNLKTGKTTKLLLQDANGIKYNLDAVIANAKMQPLVLLESKYIRYKKHNRDKGSWVCMAHPSLRKRFASIRSSIAVLAGSWSKTSKAMMESAGITLFEIPFGTICGVLADFGIDFNWGEKERNKAFDAWKKFCKLPEDKIKIIGKRLIEAIRDKLSDNISKILDSAISRDIKRIEVQVRTNLGEIKIFAFDRLEEATNFLENLTVEEIFEAEGSPALFKNIEEDKLV